MHKQMTEDLKRAKDISERELDNYKVISQEREREREQAHEAIINSFHLLMLLILPSLGNSGRS